MITFCLYEIALGILTAIACRGLYEVHLIEKYWNEYDQDRQLRDDISAHG